jgi:hypothetical protein
VYLDKVNCEHLLLKTNRDIRCLNYELQKVIQRKDEDNFKLENKRPIEIEVL